MKAKLKALNVSQSVSGVLNLTWYRSGVVLDKFPRTGETEGW